MSEAALAIDYESPGRQWSTYQQAIFAAIREGKAAPHLVVSALAGSGKSTTLEECVLLTAPGDRVLVCAFNKSIADAMAARLPEDVTCKTLHSLGLQAISRARGSFPKISQWYVSDAARTALRALGPKGSKEAANATSKLVSRAKGALGAYTDLDSLADEMGLEVEPNHRNAVLRTASALMMAADAAVSGLINFDDMIFMPAVQRLQLPRFDWVFVDETQDLNPTQLRLIHMMADAGARIVAVGDPNQAIYGFRGADKDAMPRMVRELDAAQLPLSICYRCATSIIAEARVEVPAIEAAPGAPEGSVTTCSVGKLKAEATPGDFVLSRTNAPLIALCHGWLRDGIKARIRGRDIGGDLATWIIKSGAGSIAELRETVDAWEAEELTRLEELGRDTNNVSEKAACLRALCSCKTTIAELVDYIEELFATHDDDGRQHEFIELSSTHRAKGLEADVVWLLRDTYMNARWEPLNGRGPLEGEKVWRKGGRDCVKRLGSEEANLFYVAKTRAKLELFYVVGPVSGADENF